MEGSEGCIVISLVQRYFGTSDLFSILKGYVVTTVVFGVVVPGLLSSMLVEKERKQRGVPVEVGGEEDYAICNAQASELMTSPHKDITTAAALFEQSCKKYSRNLFLGTRRLIGRELVTDGDGRKLEKLHLGDYDQWQTYGQVFDRACNFASGLIKLGHDVNTRAAIFADTRPEWFIAFQGCFRQNITVVTLYSSIGEDALIHSLNETQVSTLICDPKKLTKMVSISSSLNTIKNVIYFEDEGSSDANQCQSYSNWTVASFSEVKKLGQENRVHPCLPSKHDTAVIMYTSGSTGLPKGVVITHSNIVASTAAYALSFPNMDINDVYIAYLPLAHVYELVTEFVMMTAGSQIGYGSPLTLLDTSSKIKKGTKGDVSALKPTIMATVPAIIDRIRDEIYKKNEEQGGITKNLFDIGIKRRSAAVEGSWFGAWGLEKLFWDNVVFKNNRLVVGGRIRYIICSGAPLSSDSQQFISICMCAPVRQAYGMTETFGGATIVNIDDTTVRRVGAPLQSFYIKLVPWKDGGYLTTDKPMPRGEIVVGGPSVTAGYFKNQEKTDEVYKVDENGVRWFYTGDIGRFHPDGCLELIDRKKDIVKLQHGEYISLGKVEAALISSHYVDRIMVYADPFHTYSIALVVPVRQELEKWASEAGIKYIDFSELCGRAEAVSEVQQSLIKVGKAEKLVKYEIPGKIYLAPDPWTPESGLVTAALKIKREQIKSKFKSEIERLMRDQGYQV